MENFGGCEVIRGGVEGDDRFVFSEAPYHYSMQTLLAGQELDSRGLKSFTLFIYKLAERSAVTINGKAHDVSEGQAFQVEDTAFSLKLVQGRAVFLLAGIKESCAGRSGIVSTAYGNLKRVIKPWGHELWINGDSHPGYVLKQIFIKSGNRTSLQYHHEKYETLVLFDGRMRLHYKTGSCDNDSVTDGDLGHVDLTPLSSVTNRPGMLHRMESLSDITIYEASTPHLDDVIRVSDDSGRGHGRIATEHGASK